MRNTRRWKTGGVSGSPNGTATVWAHPRVFDYPYRLGRWFDPYNQNVLKGDYPIIGQHTFFVATGVNSTLFEGRMIPTATTPFESTARPFTTDFFGKSGQFVFSNLTTVSFELFQGDAAFKPKDWSVLLTPAFNANTLSVQEVGVVSPDVRKGTVRDRSWATLQEWFGEYKIADLSPEYDFVSVRAGSQPFTSDFRGFIFSDVNRGIRFFGDFDGNRTQYNIAYFRQLEKDTNSQLNTFNDRNQNIVVANVYRQDFLFPGFTAEASFHYNNDAPSFLFDKNGFLVRPDPAGVPLRTGSRHTTSVSPATATSTASIFRTPSTGSSATTAATPSPGSRRTSVVSWPRAELILRPRLDACSALSGLYQSGDGNRVERPRNRLRLDPR